MHASSARGVVLRMSRGRSPRPSSFRDAREAEQLADKLGSSGRCSPRSRPSRAAARRRFAQSRGVRSRAPACSRRRGDDGRQHGWRVAGAYSRESDLDVREAQVSSVDCNPAIAPWFAASVLSQRRIVVATWSLRLRPVCSFAPTGQRAVSSPRYSCGRLRGRSAT